VLDLASDTGTTGDGKTSNTTPTFKGTAETDSTVHLFATNVPKEQAGHQRQLEYYQ